MHTDIICFPFFPYHVLLQKKFLPNMIYRTVRSVKWNLLNISRCSNRIIRLPTSEHDWWFVNISWFNTLFYFLLHFSTKESNIIMFMEKEQLHRHIITMLNRFFTTPSISKFTKALNNELSNEMKYQCIIKLGSFWNPIHHNKL